jgi:hypothetical protein
MQLPPLKDIDAVLRRTAETLARELAAPSAQAPQWDEFHWRMARAAAVIHGVSPLLASRLRWHGPPGWTQFLQQERRQVELRHERIERQLQLIDESARTAGIAVMALKGSALHRLGFCVPGERPMADIDLLIGPQDAATASLMVSNLGYRETLVSWRHRCFEPEGPAMPLALGENAAASIKIEVHASIAERLPLNEVEITRALHLNGAPPGLQVYGSIESTLLHQLLHAAGNMSVRWLRLLQLHDIAVIARRMNAGDWARLLDCAGPIRQLWWAYPPLKLTARYFSGAVPEHVLAALARPCPWLLRARADRYLLEDVSCSSLWAAAAPAAAWAPSVGELCHYLWRRVRPTRDDLASVNNFARAQTWAAADSWYAASQWRRVLRWLTSRPARPQILLAVRLAQESP